MTARTHKPYHKRWHGDALQGYRKLSLELRGAYTTLLDVMYDHGGPVEERFACVWLECDPRVWKRIKRELTEEHQKLHAYTDQNGVDWLVNERVQRELGLPTYAELVANLAPKFAIAPAHVIDTSEKNRNEINGSKLEKIPVSPPLIPLPLPENSVPSERAPSAVSDEDHSKEGWDLALEVLMGQGRLSRARAASFFGKLLRDTGLQPRELIPSLTKAKLDRTADPTSYLSAAGKRLAKSMGAKAVQPDPLDWGDAEWRMALRLWREEGVWGDDMGPKPDEARTRAPPHLLAEFAIESKAPTLFGRSAA